MNSYCRGIYIVGPSSLFLRGVAVFLSLEGFSVTEWTSLEDFVAYGEGSRGLVFVDSNCLEPDYPAAIRGLLACFTGLSVIVVCDADKVGNLEMAAMLLAGADDVVRYGMDKAVLVAKTKAHLRRLPAAAAGGRLTSSDGYIELDSGTRKIKLGDYGQAP